MTGWTWETEPECFKDVDTKWHMDDKLTWLSPDGDHTKTFAGTLGEMISEAFHSHAKSKHNTANHAKNYRKFSIGTVCEISEWETDTKVNSNRDFSGKKN